MTILNNDFVQCPPLPKFLIQALGEKIFLKFTNPRFQHLVRTIRTYDQTLKVFLKWNVRHNNKSFRTIAIPKHKSLLRKLNAPLFGMSMFMIIFIFQNKSTVTLIK